MPKHIWTVVNLDTGEVRGTNDIRIIGELVKNDEYICIHSEGTYFNGDRTPVDIETITSADDDTEAAEDD